MCVKGGGGQMVSGKGLTIQGMHATNRQSTFRKVLRLEQSSKVSQPSWELGVVPVWPVHQVHDGTCSGEEKGGKGDGVSGGGGGAEIPRFQIC